MPTTRSMAKTTELDFKLRNALETLKSTQMLCDKLLQEREDSEIELQKVIKKNSELKNELSEQDIKYMDLLDQRDQLQGTITSLDQCNEVHEQALTRIHILERELSVAQGLVEQLEAEKCSRHLKETQELYEELVGKNLINGPGMNISRKTCKKLGKINKLIRKTSLKIKTHCNKCCKNSDKYKHERLELLKRLNYYSTQLNQCKTEYDLHTGELDLEICKLKKSLSECQNKYDLAEKQIEQHIRSANELLELCNYNSARFESLTTKHSCDCGGFVSSGSQPSMPTSMGGADAPSIGTDKVCLSPGPTAPAPALAQRTPKTVIFSDALGKNLGPIFSNSVEHLIENICYPGASFDCIVDKVCNRNFERDSNIVIMSGDSNKIKISQIKRNVENLIHLSSQINCKITICAFPFCMNMSQSYNEYVYNLNLKLYNLTCCHSDRILYFDTNSFIHNFTLTEGTMYLAMKEKKRLAKSLANSILYRTDCIQSVITCVTTERAAAAGDSTAGMAQPLNVLTSTPCHAGASSGAPTLDLN